MGYNRLVMGFLGGYVILANSRAPQSRTSKPSLFRTQGLEFIGPVRTVALARGGVWWVYEDCTEQANRITIPYHVVQMDFSVPHTHGPSCSWGGGVLLEVWGFGAVHKIMRTGLVWGV